jgi:hypothetical protein
MFMGIKLTEGMFSLQLLLLHRKESPDLKNKYDCCSVIKNKNRSKKRKPFINPDKIMETLSRIESDFCELLRSLESNLGIYQEILRSPRI